MSNSVCLLFQSVPCNQWKTDRVVDTVGGGVGSHLAVGAPPLSPTKFRNALSRMNSVPASTTVSSLSAVLDKLTLHQAAQAQQHRRLERTQSAPAPAVSSSLVQSVNAAVVNTSRYKTELCRPFEEFGECKYGEKCQFAHGSHELRSLARHPKYKTELCRTFHTSGYCPYGMRCHFVHGEETRGSMVPPLASIIPKGSAIRPTALSPALSLDSPSPASSLSQSPTLSMSSSFFSSESDIYLADSPTASPTVLTPQHNRPHHNTQPTHTVTITTIHATQINNCPPSPTDLAECRLPVFNKLSATNVYRPFGDATSVQ